jgi:putative component of toxin-antitoxin plasmid stabilization module
MASDDIFNAGVPKEVEEDAEFVDWSDDIDGSQLILIEAAKEKIKNLGVVSSTKDLQDGLYEKKWKNGLRLYFAVIENSKGQRTLLLLGSGKGLEQDKAIRKSREILKKYKVVKTSIKLP